MRASEICRVQLQGNSERVVCELANFWAFKQLFSMLTLAMNTLLEVEGPLVVGQESRRGKTCGILGGAKNAAPPATRLAVGPVRFGGSGSTHKIRCTFLPGGSKNGSELKG